MTTANEEMLRSREEKLLKEIEENQFRIKALEARLVIVNARIENIWKTLNGITGAIKKLVRCE